MKTISILLALVNALIAGLLIAYSLSGSEIRQAEVLWSLTKVAAALTVIAVGVLTWFGSISHVRSGLMSLSSLFLVALGAATVVWTLHRAIVIGDMEYYMILYGGSLAAQGMASLFGMLQEPGSASIV